jgi:hypothetical protein
MTAFWVANQRPGFQHQNTTQSLFNRSLFYTQSLRHKCNFANNIGSGGGGGGGGFGGGVWGFFFF